MFYLIHTEYCKNLLRSKQIESIMSKVDNNNHDNENKYNINEKLDSSSEEIIYQEYIKCIKKH